MYRSILFLIYFHFFIIKIKREREREREREGTFEFSPGIASSSRNIIEKNWHSSIYERFKSLTVVQGSTSQNAAKNSVNRGTSTEIEQK